MGRRSINTTKSGKYMNPTDQARKEARKRELKKNKKQRQMVRMAVLKSKDPVQILQEMEKIDMIEYNVDIPPALNEKVLKDKRKKLKDTLHRVLKLYEREDPQKWVDIRREEAEYEKRRASMLSFYESVRYAQSVDVNEIPLPIQTLTPTAIPLPADIPLPMLPKVPQHGILKKTTSFGTEFSIDEPPGVPPGPPPELSDDEPDRQDEILNPPGEEPYDPLKDDDSLSSSDEDRSDDDRRRRRRDSDDEDRRRRRRRRRAVKFDDSDSNSDSEDDRRRRRREEEKRRPPPKPQPSVLQQKMLALAGQDLDQFMKEMEEVHKAQEEKRAQEKAKLELEREKDKRRKETEPETAKVDMDPNQMVQSMQRMGAPPGPPPLMFRPPPPGIRVPPGPPPGVPPIRAGVRLPPGPPPGIPPHLLRANAPMSRMPGQQPPTQQQHQQQQQPVTAISAAPQLINRAAVGKSEPVASQSVDVSTTIQAKPQIRNLSAELTKMVPTAVRVRRDDKGKKRVQNRNERGVSQAAPVVHPSKDDAYSQFMREMEGLLM